MKTSPSCTSSPKKSIRYWQPGKREKAIRARSEVLAAVDRQGLERAAARHVGAAAVARRRWAARPPRQPRQRRPRQPADDGGADVHQLERMVGQAVAEQALVERVVLGVQGG